MFPTMHRVLTCPSINLLQMANVSLCSDYLLCDRNHYFLTHSQFHTRFEPCKETRGNPPSGNILYLATRVLSSFPSASLLLILVGWNGV